MCAVVFACIYHVTITWHTHTSRDHKVIHCRIHTKADEGVANIKYYMERDVMFSSIYELVQYYMVSIY